MPEIDTESSRQTPVSQSAQELNEAWKSMQAQRHRADSAVFWDARAKTFSSKDTPSAYATRFLELADIHEGESVLDMGCGPGSLALPLARKKHMVTAADFSAGMLAELRSRAQARELNFIHTLQMSWEDDWALYGVSSKSHDVCLASRSIAVADLREALLRLTDTARRRVCITLCTNSSPRVDARIMEAVGLENLYCDDARYAFGILKAEGLKPVAHPITSTRVDTFNTPTEAFEKLSEMIDIALKKGANTCTRADARKRLQIWLDDNLIANSQATHATKLEHQGVWRLRNPRTITWDFIAWDV